VAAAVQQPRRCLTGRLIYSQFATAVSNINPAAMEHALQDNMDQHLPSTLSLFCLFENYFQFSKHVVFRGIGFRKHFFYPSPELLKRNHTVLM
jgi:hypothetical protein